MMMGRVFGYGFTRRNISCWTLYGVEGFDNRYLLWGEKSIDTYLKKLLDEQPNYVLGMGIYTGRDIDKIRIETECSNRHKSEFIEGNRESVLEMNPFVSPGRFSKMAKGMGRSYCNLISFRIQNLINGGKLHSEFSFLHIPKKFDRRLAVEEVEEMLD